MRDVVVTGLGAVTPVGTSLEETWEAMRKGESGAGPITVFDVDEYAYDFRTEAACEVDADLTAQAVVDERSMGRHSQLGVVAAREALVDAGYGPEPDWSDPNRVGVSIASCLGGQLEIDENQWRLREEGSVATRFSIQLLPSSVAGHVSIAFDARGSNRAPSTACAAGAHAISAAVDDIRLGRTDVVIAGGADAGVCSTGLGAFDALRAMSTRDTEPAAAIRPFDETRDGFFLAEGAGILVLEAAEHATDRGATVYAEIEGTGRSADADHPARPASDARGLVNAVESALGDAGRDPTEIDCVNAHATATPRGDEHEALCLDRVFEDCPPVTATKSTVGHSLGASGAIEAVVSTLTVDRNLVPPTWNYERPDPDCSVPVVAEPREMTVETVLSNSAGFGGTNGAVVFGSYE